MTPYFRKSSSSSVVADIVWPSGSDDASSKSASPNERSIPLRLCHVSLSGNVGTDSGRQTIEIRSPDTKSSILLRCPDEACAAQWLAAMAAVVSSLTPSAVTDFNSTLAGMSPNNNSQNDPCPIGEVKHVGWLNEQVLCRNIRPLMPYCI